MLELNMFSTTAKIFKLIVLSCILLLSTCTESIRTRTMTVKTIQSYHDTLSTFTNIQLLDTNFLKLLVSKVNADSLTRTIQDLQNFKTRWMYSPNRKKVAEYLYNRFKSFGLEVEYDEFEFIAPLLRGITSLHNTDKIWTVGHTGIILHSTDKGESWQTQQKDGCRELTRVFFIDELRGWSVGSQGIIYNTKDGGTTWNSLPKLTNGYDITGVVFVDPLNGWICANSTSSDTTIAKIFSTEDGGLNWTHQFESSETNFYNICFTTTDSGWAVGSNGIIVSTYDRGYSWETQNISTSYLRDIDFVDSKCGYTAAGKYEWSDSTGEYIKGIIYKTVDGGQTWTEVYSDTNQYYSGVDFTDKNHGWVADRMGSILYTNDGGETWQLKKKVEGNVFYSIVSTDSNSCIAISWPPEVYRTIDGGSSWEINTPQVLHKKSENIVAIKPGYQSPDSIVIIGGHYDSISDDPFNYAPGADDNASGTAAVIEIARILSNYNSKYTLEFIAFAGEEGGLRGSKHYAKKAKASDKNVRTMVNFDAIGYPYPASPQWSVMIQSYSTSARLTELAANMTKTYTELVPQVVGKPGGRTDHYWFSEEGYQTLFFHEWEDWNNPNWHRTSDELSTLSVPYEVEIVKVGLATIANLVGLKY